MPLPAIRWTELRAPVDAASRLVSEHEVLRAEDAAALPPTVDVCVAWKPPSHARRRRIDFLAALPEEIAIYTLSLLRDHADVLRAACVSRTWHRLASDPTLWRLLLVHHPGWGVRWDRLARAPLSVRTAWRALYMDRYELDRRWMALQTLRRAGAPPAAFRPAIVRLRGHTDSVYACCIDAAHGTGGTGYIVSGSRDRTIRVWDAATAACVATLHGHGGSVVCLAHDDGVLVSGSSDATARVWRRGGPGAPHYVLAHVLRGHSAGVLDVAFDAHYIVTASRDTTVRVWRRDDARLVHVYDAHRGSVNACSVRDGLVATGAGDGSIYVWRIATGETVCAVREPRCGVASIVLAGAWLVAGSSDHTVRVWCVATGACVGAFAAHTKLVRALAYDAARQLLVSGGWDRTTRVWDVARFGEPCAPGTAPPLVVRLGMHQARIFDVAVDTTRVLSACEDGTVWVADFGHQGLASDLFA
ncbi:hypothetical protein GLX27_003791 [Malassezia furfur]|uniref:F-box domain-containing protein n=1 Tax=Malassezia furfur TaxID=55194 RepID=A0ABY8EYS1_MALFU|nr:hypothetical protein CBS14141_004083 [Malassezia furfur]WFD49113.1 hypothetical protein GLX27_003791 [Malassezia furfur]